MSKRKTETESSPQSETSKNRFAEVLAKSPYSLKDIERMSKVNYTTLNNLKFGRDINYTERTKRDVAACLGMTANELFPPKKAKYNTPFERLCIEKDKSIEDVHLGTGLSYSILNGLNMGVDKKLSARTKRDLIEYFDTTEEVLFGPNK